MSSLLSRLTKQPEQRTPPVSTSAGAPAREISVEEVSPEYVRLTERKNALISRLEVLNAEKRELGSRATTSKALLGVAERDIRVAVLAGEPVPALSTSDKARYHECLAELGEAKEALDIIEVKLRAEHAAASRLVCERFRDEHQSLLSAILFPMLEAHRAWVAYEALLDRVQRSGANIAYLRPERPDFLGVHPGDRAGDLAYWLTDLVQAGHISRADCPEEFR